MSIFDLLTQPAETTSNSDTRTTSSRGPKKRRGGKMMSLYIQQPPLPLLKSTASPSIPRRQHRQHPRRPLFHASSTKGFMAQPRQETSTSSNASFKQLSQTTKLMCFPLSMSRPLEGASPCYIWLQAGVTSISCNGVSLAASWIDSALIVPLVVRNCGAIIGSEDGEGEVRSFTDPDPVH
jgi:hypothetical protein